MSELKFDLGAFSEQYAQANEAGREVVIRNPDTGRPCGVTVTIAGPYSRRQEDAQRDYGDWVRENPGASDSQREDALRRRFARGVIGWGFDAGVTFRGGTPECTISNVVAVFETCRWFYDQVVTETGESRGFIKG